jgi:hypothetical protein
VTGDTYSQDLTALKMAVVLEGFPENKLTEEQSKKIQQAVLGEVWKCDPGTGPQFKNSYVEKVVVYITCAKEKARSWLLERRMMETVSTSETLISFCETTQCKIPEDSHLHTVVKFSGYLIFLYIQGVENFTAEK